MEGLLILKIVMAIYLIILIPLYWKTYGPQNFLWLSDVGLFLTILGLWFESPLLISMVVIGILPLEILWTIDFFIHLFLGKKFLNISEYMFNPQNALFVRLLSLFHIFIPIICIGCLIVWGYHPNALLYQIIVNSVILIATYLLTPPKENINWVFLPEAYNWYWMPSILWLLIMLIGIPLLIFLPLHLILKNLI